MSIGYDLLGRKFTLLVRRDDGLIGEATQMDMEAAGYDKRNAAEEFRQAVFHPITGITGYFMCDKCGERWSSCGTIPDPYRCIACERVHGKIKRAPQSCGDVKDGAP